MMLQACFYSATYSLYKADGTHWLKKRDLLLVQTVPLHIRRCSYKVDLRWFRTLQLQNLATKGTSIRMEVIYRRQAIGLDLRLHLPGGYENSMQIRFRRWLLQRSMLQARPLFYGDLHS